MAKKEKETKAKKVLKKIIKTIKKTVARKAKTKAKKAALAEPQILRPVTENKLVEWLSPQRQIDLKLQRHLQDLPKEFILLALIKVQEYSATNIELIKFFVKQVSMPFTVGKEMKMLELKKIMLFKQETIRKILDIRENVFLTPEEIAANLLTVD